MAIDKRVPGGRIGNVFWKVYCWIFESSLGRVKSDRMYGGWGCAWIRNGCLIKQHAIGTVAVVRVEWSEM